MKYLMMILLVISCGKNGDDGSNGVSGSNGVNGIEGNSGLDGLDYYSYEERGSIQEIIGDEVDELLTASSGDFYQLPNSFNVNVDNKYSECQLQDLTLVFESETEINEFVFEPTNNRYRMDLKSGATNKVIAGSSLLVYYKNKPKVICDDGEYELHSGIDFKYRVIKELEIE